MCCIDPIIMPPSHYMFLQVCSELKLIHRNLQVGESAS
jgi:hypothetical protein